MGDGYLIQPSFQSTHPVWGGTRISCLVLGSYKFQSTHPVWGGTTYGYSTAIELYGISIHPPRVGWDLRGTEPIKRGKRFQSTHPVWGGTEDGADSTSRVSISIHPPRVGWDIIYGLPYIINGQFQSTHPVWGGTASSTRKSPGRKIFQSTHPVWGGTTAQGYESPLQLYFNPPTPCGVGRLWRVPQGPAGNISIHPPRVGWDVRR